MSEQLKPEGLVFLDEKQVREAWTENKPVDVLVADYSKIELRLLADMLRRGLAQVEEQGSQEQGSQEQGSQEQARLEDVLNDYLARVTRPGFPPKVVVLSNTVLYLVGMLHDVYAYRIAGPVGGQDKATCTHTLPNGASAWVDGADSLCLLCKQR